MKYTSSELEVFIQTHAKNEAEKERLLSQLHQQSTSISHFQDMFSNHMVVKLLIDPTTGLIIDANQAATTFYQYELAELKQLHIQDINILPTEEVEREMQRAREEERNFFQFRHRLASGDIRDVDVFSVPIQAEEKTLLYSIIFDVSEMRESIFRYRALFEQSNDAIFILDLDGNYIDVNKRATELLGYTYDELLEISFREIVVYTEVHKSEGVLKRLQAGEHIAPYERLFRCQNGDIIVVEVNAEIVNDIYDNPLYIQSVVRDITHRKKIEYALRRNKQRLKMTVDVTNVGTWAWNIETNELIMNERWAEMAGYAKSELEPISFNTWHALLHPDDLEIYKASLEAYLNAEVDTYQLDVRIRHKDGYWVWVATQGQILEWTHDGQPQWMYGTHFDITDMKERYAKEMQLMLETKRTELLTSFIQNVAHEFRTPLSVIQTSAYLLARIDDRDIQDEKVTLIHDEINLITKLLDTMLLISRLESDSNTLFNKTPCQLNQLIRYALQTILEQYQVQPRLQLMDNLPTINGDEALLTNTIKQLLDNAYRHTPKNTEVLVKTGWDDEVVWVEIWDNGHGLSDADLNHIFEMFWRKDMAHTTRGLGLGLTIAKKVAERHRGTLTVRPNPNGHGLCAKMTLSRSK